MADERGRHRMIEIKPTERLRNKLYQCACGDRTLSGCRCPGCGTQAPDESKKPAKRPYSAISPEVQERLRAAKREQANKRMSKYFKKALKLAPKGLKPGTVAERIGLNRQTFYYHLKHNQEFAEKYNAAVQGGGG